MSRATSSRAGSLPTSVCAPEPWLQRIAAGWHELGGRRAVLLVQLPPSQPRDDARLACFLRLMTATPMRCGTPGR